MKSCFAIVLLALVSLNARAGVHKWVDPDGTVHYSDTRPQNNDIETQAVRNVAGKDLAEAPAASSPKSLAEREAEMKKARQEKMEAAEKQQQQDAQVQAKKSNCAAARENERTLEQSPRIVTYDEKGEKTYMEDSTRAQKLEEARRIIRESCN
ncbi:MAG: DUF4124 domain-containing protein [Nitrosomonadales bacterium]|nr:DUF4124 domain-containing protein [Nitrosomonadales bacterium]